MKDGDVRAFRHRAKRWTALRRIDSGQGVGRPMADGAGRSGPGFPARVFILTDRGWKAQATPSAGALAFGGEEFLETGGRKRVRRGWSRAGSRVFVRRRRSCRATHRFHGSFHSRGSGRDWWGGSSRVFRWAEDPFRGCGVAAGDGCAEGAQLAFPPVMEKCGTISAADLLTSAQKRWPKRTLLGPLLDANDTVITPERPVGKFISFDRTAVDTVTDVASGGGEEGADCVDGALFLRQMTGLAGIVGHTAGLAAAQVVVFQA